MNKTQLLTPFSLLLFPLRAYAGYQDDWWKTDYFPGFENFIHMVVFVGWWSLAALPALVVVGFIFIFIIAVVTDNSR